MQMRKSKADQTVEGLLYFFLYNIAKGTVFLRQGGTNCGFRKLDRYNLNMKTLY